MSFTEAGFKKVISGEFSDGILIGRLGLQLVSINKDTITVQYFVADLKENKVLFEYDQIDMVPGQQVLLNGAEARIPIEIA